MPSPWRHPNHRPSATLPVELRRTTIPTHVREWIDAATGSHVFGVRRLAGASSTAVHAIALEDGAVLVLRRYVWRHYLENEPEAPQRELDALAFAGTHGLVAPEPIAADTTGAAVGDGIPVILMSRLPGRALVEPPVDDLAEQLVRIHAVSPNGFGHQYFHWYRGTSTRPPPTAKRPDLWERALELWHTAEPDYTDSFVHRDYHPGNVLWTRGRLGGVVDWVNACRGPAGVDVATCRWNLIRWAGVDAANAFVSAYQRISGTTHHPFWDVSYLLEDDYDLGRVPSQQIAATELQLAVDVPRLERFLAS